MTTFTLLHWQDALSKVFARAVIDPEYRQTCLHHPRTAVAEVSDIDLPPYFKFEFVEVKEEITYSYTLPPLQPELHDASVKRVIESIIEFFLHCTEPTTGI